MLELCRNNDKQIRDGGRCAPRSRLELHISCTTLFKREKQINVRLVRNLDEQYRMSVYKTNDLGLILHRKLILL